MPRQISKVLAGVVAVIVLWVVAAWWRNELDAEPHWRSEPGCPAEFPDVSVAGWTLRLGDLVPAGASDALLCIYRPPSSPDELRRGQAVLGGSRELVASAGDLVNTLNGLPAPGIVEELFGSCGAAGFATYQLVISYGERALAVVISCGTAQQGGVPRLMDSASLDRVRLMFGLSGPPTLEG